MMPPLTQGRFDAWPARIVRRLRRRHNDLVINIVAYHSIDWEESVFTAGTDLRHDPGEFERQMDYLAEHYRPIGLRQLISSVECGEAPHRSVVVTLDDGYADSLRRAAPILFRRRIPMTIFPVTSVIGNADLLWQHKLVWLLANGHAAKVEQALTAEGGPPPGDGELLEHYVRRCYRPDLPEILEAVLRSTGTSGPQIAAKLRPYLEVEEMAKADREFIEFGNHTHTHPVLSALSLEQQRREIETARDKLAAVTGYAPPAFAYPFGLRPHYTEQTKRIVQATGHRAALDLRRRFNVGRVDLFELSRKPAPRGSQEAFEKFVEDWPANAPLPGPGGVE